ncbi:N-acetylneuraminate synthase family protein [Alphaproteobacteria bacterium]|nr:N-acetylneuraminate synthase family protein [Alphaproteobacteria bacterium]
MSHNLSTHRCKIIAEIGINHHGDLRIAKKLIDESANSNCWGIKFQYRDNLTFYNQNNFESCEIGDEILKAEIDRTNLSVGEIVTLINYAKDKGLKVGVSFFRIADLDKFFKEGEHNLDFLKVPSAECLTLSLIDKMLAYTDLVLVSAGGHDPKKVNSLLSKYKSKIVLFHCVANYPAEFGSQRLNTISYYLDQGWQSVGYSSHDACQEVCMFAAALHACFIERHITLDKNGGGLDDSTSSEPEFFKQLSEFVNNIEGTLAGDISYLNQGEILNMQNLGTSLYATRTLEIGYVPCLDDFSICAPRKGLSVGEFDLDFQGQELHQEVKLGEPLLERHFLKFSRASAVSKDIQKVINQSEVGLPIRLHDHETINEIFDISNYEFHLSRGEVNELEGFDLPTWASTKKFSIHLPDYISSNRIIDPFSSNTSVRNESIEVLLKVIAFAKLLQNTTGSACPIVGSLSQTSHSHSDFIGQVKDLQLELKDDDIDFLPQWLPKWAWYFGGSVEINTFNSREYVDLVKSHELEICLDLSHLVLSANSAKEKWEDWSGALIPHSKHFHFANAKGENSEGLPLAKGEIKDFSDFIRLPGMKIIEIWQGHLDGYSGFHGELQFLVGEN